MSVRTESEVDCHQPSRDDVDLWMIRDNLKLSFEERVVLHQNTLDFIDELKQFAQEARAKSSSPSQITHS